MDGASAPARRKPERIPDPKARGEAAEPRSAGNVVSSAGVHTTPNLDCEGGRWYPPRYLAINNRYVVLVPKPA